MRDTLLLLALLLAACGGGSGDDDDGPADAAPPAPDGATTPDAARPDSGTDVGPEIAIDPATIDLAAEAGMASAPLTVSIANQGTDPLNVAAIELEDASGGFALADLPGVFPAVVAPGARLEVRLTYTPPDAENHTATLVVRSDDADEGEVRVPLTGRLARRCVRAAPTSVELGRVDRGARSGVFRLSVINCGDVPLPVTGVRLEGDMGFQWESDRGDPTAAPIAPATALQLNLTYENSGLDSGERATGTLVLETTDAAVLVRVPLTASGAPLGCALAVRPEQVDFGARRVDRPHPVELEVINEGTADCDIRGVVIEKTAGPPRNLIRETRALEVGRIAAGEARTFEVTYTPEVADPRGDRALLRVNYADAVRQEGRRVTVEVFGFGAEALIGPVPDRVDFEPVTAASCASRRIEASAANAGFVPLCVTGFRYEGDDCDRFVKLEEPEIDGCLLLEPEQGARFAFQHQPDDLGEDTCTLHVTSDSMNRPVLSIPLRGVGVEADATVDMLTVGRLEPNQRAYFGLSRPAVEETIRVFVDDAPNEAWDFSDERNAISFAAADHPPRDAALRIEFDAICYERVE